MAWAVIKGVPSVNLAQVRLGNSADGSGKIWRATVTSVGISRPLNGLRQFLMRFPSAGREPVWERCRLESGFPKEQLTEFSPLSCISILSGKIL